MKTALLHTLAITALAAPLPAMADEAPPAAAAPQKLEPGSPVPEFKVAEWIQGEPVTAFEKDKTYLVECWGTACGPCVTCIPHLNTLHKDFGGKGLVVIGLNVWSEPSEKITSFVKDKGELMTYRVASITGSPHFAENWLKPANVRSVPFAFIVHDNKICWMGDPATISSRMITAIMEGTFDAKRDASNVIQQGALPPGALYDRDVNPLLAAGKFEDARKRLDELVEYSRKLGAEWESLQTTGLIQLAMAMNDRPKATALMEERNGWFDGANYIICSPVPARKRDYAYALSCLEKQNEAFASLPVPLMLKARALYKLDRKDESLEALKKIQKETPLEPERVRILSALEAGKPWPAGDFNPDND